MKLCIRAALPSLLLTLVASGVAPADSRQADTGHVRFYVGTYTSASSQGIYVGRLDLATGQLHLDGVAAETKNPSFLAIDPSRRFLYAVGELADHAGQRTGAVSAFRILPDTGRLELLNQQSSGGPGPCHVTIDEAGRHVLAANYSGGSVIALAVGEDGSLGIPTAFVQHHGSSVNPRRQQGPHAHSINLDAANRFAFVADLGLDKILIYRYDAAAGTLAVNDPPAANVAPGAGPRHLAFHPSGRFVYVLNELQSTLVVFRYDAERGALDEIQTVATLPASDAVNYPSEVQVHPSGKFVYASNRGDDTIAVFAVDAASGHVTLVQREPAQGKWPRHFGIDSTGQFLLACNQNSNSIVGFRIDSQTGKLTPTGQTLEVGSPVCVKYLGVDP